MKIDRGGAPISEACMAVLCCMALLFVLGACTAMILDAYWP